MKLSPKLTRYDRGYMTSQETSDYWSKYWHTNKAVHRLQEQKSTRSKELVAVRRDWDRIKSQELGLVGGRLWIAVKCTDSQHLFDALQARAIETILWTPNAYPSSQKWSDWWFVTPPCGGIVFIGNAHLPIDNFEKLLEQAEFLRAISWSLSPVSLFWNHGVSQIYGFARWDNGKLLRAVHSTQTTFHQKGKPLDEEPPLRTRACSEADHGQTQQDRTSLLMFGENEVLKLADTWHANPWSIPPKRENETPQCFIIKR